MLMYPTLITPLYLLLIVNGVLSSLSDVTSEVFQFGHGYPGLIAAFGDLDADKATDIFVLSEDGKSLFILEAKNDIRRDGTKLISKQFIVGSKNDDVIVSVVPGDFNSDSQMDVLVMRKVGTDQTTSEVKLEIYQVDGELYMTINETFRDQPIVIDGNGDMAPDLFGETADGLRALWTFQTNRSYTVAYYDSQKKLDPLKIPQSSAYLDLNGDLTADLCVVSEVNKVVSFEFWLNVEGKLNFTDKVQAPEQLKVLGQASFVDFNGNHEINIVLPGCLDEECKNSAVFVWAHNKNSKGAGDGSWYQLPINFKVDNQLTASFLKTVNPVSWLSLPLVLRMGDFNLDGYPDAVVVLSVTDGSNTSAFLMYNVECQSECHNFSRTLSVEFKQPLHKLTPSVITFFDLMENGVLDLLVNEVREGKPVIRAIQQEFSGDASFLKVMVVSGLCRDSCPNGHSPYGVNQVGPTAKFVSTTPTGNDQIGIASQLTQSAYFSLQLPFMLFGLGQTPNFVDELQVGIPFPTGQHSRKQSWSTIIPNSQVIVIPYPVDDPGSWKHELYVTPSRLVLLTGASLLGTCAFIAIIVGLLHWRERMEDKKEKLQESQRFHFDAM